jgi:alcohol dehydrogenase class IV
MKFNRPACPERYAEVALACGAKPGSTIEETAQRGVDFICQLSATVGIPSKLSDIGIPQSAVPHLAQAAMQVQRLLKNNPREVTEQDAINIYNSLY